MRLVSKVKPIEGDVNATVVVSASRLTIDLRPAAGAGRPKVRGDLDNYVKAALDAAQDAGWIYDDRQVVQVAAWFTSDLEQEMEED